MADFHLIDSIGHLRRLPEVHYEDVSHPAPPELIMKEGTADLISEKLLAQVLYQDDIALPAATRADKVLAVA